MPIIPIYKFTREDGGVTVSPNKPNGAYTEMYRLVADEGKAFTKDGVNTTFCADVESTDGWYEVEMTEEEYQAKRAEIEAQEANNDNT